MKVLKFIGIFILGIFAGFLIGFFIKFHALPINIIGEQLGSIADCVSALGALGAVGVALVVRNDVFRNGKAKLLGRYYEKLILEKSKQDKILVCYNGIALNTMQLVNIYIGNSKSSFMVKDLTEQFNKLLIYLNELKSFDLSHKKELLRKINQNISMIKFYLKRDTINLTEFKTLQRQLKDMFLELDKSVKGEVQYINEMIDIFQ